MWAVTLVETKDECCLYYLQWYQPSDKPTLPDSTNVSSPRLTAHLVCNCHRVASAPFFHLSTALPPLHMFSVPLTTHNGITNTPHNITVQSQFIQQLNHLLFSNVT